MDYCILSTGTETIKSNIDEHENVRSIMLYGPAGCGKTLMALAVASELGALFINFSSSTIGNAFSGKEGATKLCHMVFTVAKEKAYAPVVVYLDDCHEYFIGKQKRGTSPSVNSEMKRFQKDLLIYKNQSLKKDDRVLVIGCTSMPERGDIKLLKWKGIGGKPEKQGFFEKKLYFPNAHHADKAMIWKDSVEKKIPRFGSSGGVLRLDYQSLAYMSDGFSAGAINSIVDMVLTKKRMDSLDEEPLSEQEFVWFLEKKPLHDDERMLSFTRSFTGLESRWKESNGGSDPKKKKTK
mmetsp:Transcript_12891/g.27430  ORF Transcript_12891/g.27430 Transcript_12891/m.27430 type:complete len:294 (-) Transcript_12891:335-1216(-)